MCDKMAISAYILKIVEKDPFLRLQMTAKEMFNLPSCFSIQFLEQLMNTPYNVGSVLWRLFSTVGDGISTCGGIASVLRRLFSTVGE